MVAQVVRVTRPLVIIEDARDLETVERLTRPRAVDELQQMRAAEAPLGEGTYLATCSECGFRFRTEDRYAAVCEPCDAEDTQGWYDGGLLLWEQRRFGRGRSRG